MSHELWNVWDDKGKVGEDLSEEAARSILKDTDNPFLYAENESGDYIEFHNGPIVRKTHGDFI